MPLNTGSTNLHICLILIQAYPCFDGIIKLKRPEVLLLFRDGMETPRSFSLSRRFTNLTPGAGNK